MIKTSKQIDVYLEVGQQRIFAGAIEWPGWCRSGRDDESALQALFNYAPRYERVLRSSKLGFVTPTDVTKFVVKEHLKGNATTDFGAPGMAPSADAEPVDSAELERFQMLLKACWKIFDSAARKATGKTLRKGPRGGGRTLDNIIQHTLGGDEGYLGAVGWKLQRSKTGSQIEQTREAILKALAASTRGELPTKGPRGGIRWSPRYFVRRVAWHTLDHAWEIEDRMLKE